MKRYSFIFLTYLLFLFALNSGAQINSVLIESIHSISTGGALVPVSGDNTLIVANPAGLVDITDSKLTGLYLGTSFNMDSIRTMNEINSAYNEVNDFKKLPDKSIDKLQNYNPALIFMPAGVTYVRHGLALSFLSSGFSVRTKFDRNDKESIVNVYGIGDIMLSGSFGFQLIEGLSAGGCLKYIYRLKMDGTNASDLIDGKYTALMGRYLGTDVGVIWKKDPLSFGLLLADIFGTNLVWKKQVSSGKLSDLEKPFNTKIKKTLYLGVSYRPEWKLVKYPDIPKNTTFALSINGIDSFSKNILIGTEIELVRWLSIRLGINDGLRIGLGFRADMWLIDLVYATKFHNRYFDYTTKNNIGFSAAFGY